MSVSKSKRLHEIVKYINQLYGYQEGHPGKVTLVRVGEVMNGRWNESHPIEAMIRKKLIEAKLVTVKK